MLVSPMSFCTRTLSSSKCHHSSDKRWHQWSTTVLDNLVRRLMPSGKPLRAQPLACLRQPHRPKSKQHGKRQSRHQRRLQADTSRQHRMTPSVGIIASTATKQGSVPTSSPAPGQKTGQREAGTSGICDPLHQRFALHQRPLIQQRRPPRHRLTSHTLAGS